MKFSIISTILNEEKWIDETIKSIISQEVDFEYLIMDAGSTDRTLEIIKSFNDERLIVTHTGSKNKELKESLYGNLNLAMEKMTGDVFVILAGHQPLCDNALRIVSENINGCVWLIGNFYKVNDKGIVIKKIIRPEVTTPFIKSEFVRNNGLKFSTEYIQGDHEFYKRIKKMVGEPKRVSEFLHKYIVTSNNLFLTYGSIMKGEVKKINSIYG